MLRVGKNLLRIIKIETMFEYIIRGFNFVPLKTLKLIEHRLIVLRKMVLVNFVPKFFGKLRSLRPCAEPVEARVGKIFAAQQSPSREEGEGCLLFSEI
jgi:hypothetical protein